MELLVRKHFPNVVAGHIDIPRLGMLASFTPVLCIMLLGPELDHWVVVRGVTRKFAHYQDPDAGRQRKTLAEWMGTWIDAGPKCWARYALTGWPDV